MKRQTGIILTVASAVLCGCPGLFFCLGGALSAAGLGTYTSEFGGISDTGQISPVAGILTLCLGLLFILIPVALWFFTVRGKSDMPEAGPPSPSM